MCAWLGVRVRPRTASLCVNACVLRLCRARWSTEKQHLRGVHESVAPGILSRSRRPACGPPPTPSTADTLLRSLSPYPSSPLLPGHLSHSLFLFPSQKSPLPPMSLPSWHPSLHHLQHRQLPPPPVASTTPTTAGAALHPEPWISPLSTLYTRCMASLVCPAASKPRMYMLVDMPVVHARTRI